VCRAAIRSTRSPSSSPGAGSRPGRPAGSGERQPLRAPPLASALAAAFTLRAIHPALGAAGLGYALLLGFTLVYLGEHYVVDLLAGAGLALGVAAAEPVLAPTVRRVDAAWRHIEPRAPDRSSVRLT
jgi:membrane-associated phospholipid phosphatase